VGVPVPVTVNMRDFFGMKNELQGLNMASKQSAEESIKELGFV